MRHFLVIPLQFARVGVERDDRIGIEVIARTELVVEIGRRIAHAPIEQVQFWIVGSDQPRGSAAVLPHLLAPGFIAWFAGTGNGVEPPDMFAGLHVVGVQVSAMGVFAARAADDHFVFDD
jgi:hypothetical protein